MDRPDWWEDLLEAAPPDQRDALEADLAPPIIEGVMCAQQAWPELSLAPQAFALTLVELANHDAAFDELQIEDLYLAQACAAGDAAALEAFECLYGGDLGHSARSFAKGDRDLDDLRQQLREKLFAGPQARIGRYRGRGKLKSWLRVAVVRLLIDGERRRSGKREAPADDGELRPLPNLHNDPELAHMKRHYRDAFEAALAEALAALTPRQRNLLRQQLMHGLTVKQLAALYSVHRMTMTRWLADARTTLLKTVHASLQSDLGIAQGELDSVLRILSSQLDISVLRLLDEASLG